MAICALNFRGTVCCGIGGLLCAEYPFIKGARMF